jgi:hypothetical protein
MALDDEVKKMYDSTAHPAPDDAGYDAGKGLAPQEKKGVYQSMKRFLGKEIASFSRNTEYILGAAALALGTFTDYYSTAIGMASGAVGEINPIIDWSISHFGTDMGIGLVKAAGAMATLGACYYLGRKQEQQDCRLERDSFCTRLARTKPEKVLYAGGVLFASFGSSWWLQKMIYDMLY